MQWQLTASDWASLSRIIVAPLSAVLFSPWAYSFHFVLLLSCFAILTDYLDGYWARKDKTTSVFGAFLDFTADKVFVLTMLTVLSLMGLLPIWMLLVILNRELIVMGVRLYAAIEGLAIPAHFMGKLKTVFTFAGINAILFHHIVQPMIATDLAWIPWLLMFIAVILTVVSGLDYAKKVMDYVMSKR